MTYSSQEEMQALVERLEAANAEARDLLRDINTASKDLRKTIRDAKEVATTEIREQLTKEVSEQLGELGDATKEAMRRSVAKVEAEFDRLAGLLTGKKTDDPLEALIRKARYSSEVKR